MRRWMLLALCGGILWLCLPRDAIACRCAGALSPRAAYQRAPVVVRAEVRSVTGDINKAGVTATLRVSQAWKKRVSREVTVFTNTTCAFVFRPGTEYLLYLYETPAEGYYTARCLGNLPITAANQSLAWLDRYGALAAVE